MEKGPKIFFERIDSEGLTVIRCNQFNLTRDMKRKRRKWSIGASSLSGSCRSNIWMFRQELTYVGQARSISSNNRTLLQENQRKMCRACPNNKTFVERAERSVQFKDEPIVYTCSPPANRMEFRRGSRFRSLLVLRPALQPIAT